MCQEYKYAEDLDIMIKEVYKEWQKPLIKYLSRSLNSYEN